MANELKSLTPDQLAEVTHALHCSCLCEPCDHGTEGMPCSCFDENPCSCGAVDAAMKAEAESEED